MIEELTVMVVRILASLIAGAAIGFERGFHGRPAGFRTHALVCLASALLMLVTVFQDSWMTQVAVESIRTDPTRMAQGIMTGIGFLGAGVIFKEGATVRGLTTAATIWITSAIGVLIGVGFYFAAAAGVQPCWCFRGYDGLSHPCHEPFMLNWLFVSTAKPHCQKQNCVTSFLRKGSALKTCRINSPPVVRWSSIAPRYAVVAAGA